MTLEIEHGMWLTSGILKVSSAHVNTSSEKKVNGICTDIHTANKRNYFKPDASVDELSLSKILLIYFQCIVLLIIKKHNVKCHY